MCSISFLILLSISALNERETGSAIYGVSKFADIAQEEFESTFLNASPKQSEGNVVSSVPPYNGTSSFVDWTGVYTTPVKDQGYCGSCW